MKTSTKIVIGGVALVAVAGAAIASEGIRRHGDRERMGQKMFQAADTNADQAVSQEELLAALGGRFATADADKDGKLSKAEIVAAIEAAPEIGKGRHFSGRFADRMVFRLDLDGDGFVALTEIENRSRKMFALADWNDDGKVEIVEIRRMHPGMGRHGGRSWRRGGDDIGNDG